MNFSTASDRILQNAAALLGQDSPSGFTRDAVALAEGIAQSAGYETSRPNRGGLMVHIPGREAGTTVALCAHIDTLGLMVRSIAEDGSLRFTKVGGPVLPSLDGEYCTVVTRAGKRFSGTVLSLSPAAHVFPDSASRVRDEENMYVRLDEVAHTKEEVRALGIAPGDYICIDPKTVVTESGFLKSRFIDDKGGSACLLTLLELMAEQKVRPKHDALFLFTVYEEVGHGGAILPPEASELLAVDMGCIGADLACTEQQVSICAKDSAGPYDYEMVSRLIALADGAKLDYAVDVYPYYSSDAAVAWKAGRDVRAALIGPGVHASHGMERTHRDGLLNTLKLCALYLDCQ